jgi:protein-disulfide isomerase
MKAYLISAAISVTSIALAVGFFFAGYSIRGAIDADRLATAGTNGAGSPAAQPALASQPAAPVPTAAVAAPFMGTLRTDGGPARGPDNAKVTLVEFSDFQCPFCKDFFDQTEPLLTSTYRDSVRWVYRDFPIASLHPQAEKAAEAGQCAFEEGKFWEYHDRLFRNQGQLDVPSLKAHAAAIGLDANTFAACLDSGKYSQTIQDEFKEGLGYGVTGTPTFYINGRKLVGAQSFAEFQKVLEEELARTSGSA